MSYKNKPGINFAEPGIYGNFESEQDARPASAEFPPIESPGIR
jgi:hypothetical protein